MTLSTRLLLYICTLRFSNFHWFWFHLDWLIFNFLLPIDFLIFFNSLCLGDLIDFFTFLLSIDFDFYFTVMSFQSVLIQFSQSFALHSLSLELLLFSLLFFVFSSDRVYLDSYQTVPAHFHFDVFSWFSYPITCQLLSRCWF